MAISEAIRELRRRMNLTHNRLAILIGVSRDSIYRYESLGRLPNGCVLLLLCGIASNRGYDDLVRIFVLGIRATPAMRLDTTPPKTEGSLESSVETIWLFRTAQLAEGSPVDPPSGSHASVSREEASA